jgi:Zn-dependent protease with chaperone function
MKALRLALLVLLLPPASSHAQVSEFDHRIAEELRQKNPEAVSWFELANAAREHGDLAAADSLYAAVADAVPDFDHAIRRRSGILLDLGRVSEAVALARRALDLDPSANNRSALTRCLLVQADQGPKGTQLIEATNLADAVVADPEADRDDLVLAAMAAIRASDAELARRSHQRLLVEAPDWWVTHYVGFFANALTGAPESARASLERARTLGMPDDEYRNLKSAMDSQRPFLSRMARPAGWIAIGWVAGLLVLLMAGVLLSRAAMAAARRIPAARTGQVVGLDAVLRRVYRGVLWVSCAYYYVSLPLILLLVAGSAGAIVYASFAVGRIPVKLLFLVVVVAVVTIGAVLKSLAVRGRDEDPGERIDPKDHPKLWKTLLEVADRVGTRPVDNVYLSPGTELAVMERGGMLKQLRNMTERCLILGVGVLPGMKVGPFRAVLAHEYGHFSNKDTAGGGFALAVRRSLHTMALHLASGGAAEWYNPAWLFLNGFYRVFLRVSQGASRLQEVLADRWAAFLYGANAFEAGLRHVVERSVRFNAHVGVSFREIIENSKPLSNLYTYTPSQPMDEDEIQRAIAESINAEPSPYDSHPGPAERFASVHALGVTDTRPKEQDSDAEVWSLFSDRDAIERWMTDRVREGLLASRGIRIRTEAGPETASSPATN